MNLQTFVDERLLRTGRRCHLIVENSAAAGLVTPHEVKSAGQAHWPYTTVYDTMVPIDRLNTVNPETPVAEALELLGRADVNQLTVVSKGGVARLLLGSVSSATLAYANCSVEIVRQRRAD